jgi:hypothetical protein
MGIILGGNNLSGTNFNTLGEIPTTPTVITDGLVLWLDAGNLDSFINTSANYYDCGYGYQYYVSNPGCTAASTKWFDISGNGADGVLTNGVSINYDSGGGAMLFDGTNDYVNIPTFNNQPTSQITCEAWINPTEPISTGTVRGGVISATNTMYLGIFNSVDGGSTHSLHWANTTNSSRPYSYDGNIPNNTWSHIVGTWDGTTSRAYVNNTQVWSAAQSGTIDSATYVVGTYGGGLTDGTHNFQGQIAIARVYNRALSVSEILNNYNNGRARFGI